MLFREYAPNYHIEEGLHWTVQIDVRSTTWLAEFFEPDLYD